MSVVCLKSVRVFVQLLSSFPQNSWEIRRGQVVSLAEQLTILLTLICILSPTSIWFSYGYHLVLHGLCAISPTAVWHPYIIHLVFTYPTVNSLSDEWLAVDAGELALLLLLATWQMWRKQMFEAYLCYVYCDYQQCTSHWYCIYVFLHGVITHYFLFSDCVGKEEKWVLHAFRCLMTCTWQRWRRKKGARSIHSKPTSYFCVYLFSSFMDW